MKILLVALSVLLTACSTLPDAIETAPEQDIQLEQVSGHVTAYIGQTVRWGGQIVEVSNNDDYSTLHIVQFPLNRFGRPITTQASQGRFLAQSTEFFDPVIYKEGKRITFSGTVDSEQSRVVDAKTLQLPVINIVKNHRWLKKQSTSGYYIGVNHSYGYVYPYWYYRNYDLQNHYRKHH